MAENNGGGGGPKFSFSTSLNVGAAEFVPSWLPKEPAAAPAASSPVQSKKQEKQEELVKQVKQMTVKPKKEDEVEEEEAFNMTDVKENANILFMGHVDAGKSTMGGHILFLTGMVDKRTMEKYEQEAKELGRESWYLSWALDLNQEERDKGKTTEYGRGAFTTEKRRYTIIDAPGHRNYIPSMIEGASQADFGILVISARKGEFETGFERDGQTREHVLLAKTAGVKRIVMVINKMDDPTVEWAQSRYDEIVGKMMPFLKATGYIMID
jgi:peptide chain release factor subunit 3